MKSSQTVHWHTPARKDIENSFNFLLSFWFRGRADFMIHFKGLQFTVKLSFSMTRNSASHIDMKPFSMWQQEKICLCCLMKQITLILSTRIFFSWLTHTQLKHFFVDWVGEYNILKRTATQENSELLFPYYCCKPNWHHS